jgi:hypothetical protein
MNPVLSWYSRIARHMTCQCYDQGCQMVFFLTKNHNLGKYWRAWDWKILIDFTAIGKFYDHMVHSIVFICVHFSILGIMHQEKSGNPGYDHDFRRFRQNFCKFGAFLENQCYKYFCATIAAFWAKIFLRIVTLVPESCLYAPSSQTAHSKWNSTTGTTYGTKQSLDETACGRNLRVRNQRSNGFVTYL